MKWGTYKGGVSYIVQCTRPLYTIPFPFFYRQAALFSLSRTYNVNGVCFSFTGVRCGSSIRSEKFVSCFLYNLTIQNEYGVQFEGNFGVAARASGHVNIKWKMITKERAVKIRV